MIRLAYLELGDEVERLVTEVLRSGRLAQGPMVERFEERCARMAGTEHAVAVANGTLALEAALEVLGIGPGDEVITTPLTFGATINAVLRTGASVRFADVGPDFNLDPRSSEALINPATALLLPVHLYGLPADMPALAELAGNAGVAILEDAAQAHGAAIEGRPVGGWGLGSFSFYATKNVTAGGEGGVLTTPDAEIAGRLRILRNQGMAERYKYEQVGRNLRLTEIQAAVAIPQLDGLDAIIARRNDHAARLAERLSAVDGLTVPTVPPGRRHVWHQYTVLLPNGCDRERVRRVAAASGVETAVHYPALVWDHPPYRFNPRVLTGDTPAATDVVRRCVSLPVHQGLSPRDVDRVGDIIAEAVGAAVGHG